MQTKSNVEKRAAFSLSAACLILTVLILFLSAQELHQSVVGSGPALEGIPAETSSAAIDPATETKLQGSPKGHSRKNRFQPIISAAATQYQVDPALIKAVIRAESSYDPSAVSKKGARGLMQLMPGTAEALGVSEPLNPEQNINGGTKYLRQLLNQFGGNLVLAVAAYNAGSRHVKTYQGIPPFKATRHYVDKVLQYYRDYKRESRRKRNSV